MAGLFPCPIPVIIGSSNSQRQTARSSRHSARQVAILENSSPLKDSLTTPPALCISWIREIIGLRWREVPQLWVYRERPGPPWDNLAVRLISVLVNEAFMWPTQATIEFRVVIFLEMESTVLLLLISGLDFPRISTG